MGSVVQASRFVISPSECSQGFSTCDSICSSRPSPWTARALADRGHPASSCAGASSAPTCIRSSGPPPRRPRCSDAMARDRARKQRPSPCLLFFYRCFGTAEQPTSKEKQKAACNRYPTQYILRLGMAPANPPTRQGTICGQSIGKQGQGPRLLEDMVTWSAKSV